MEILRIREDMTDEMLAVIRQNPWRIFCRGIFIPCADLTAEDIQRVFQSESARPTLAIGAFDSQRLTGFLFARETSDALHIFILDTFRGARFQPTLEKLLAETQRVAEETGLEKTRVAPLQPLSSAFDLKDDEALDALFKMGYWRDVLIAAEMRFDMRGWRMPAKVVEREKALADRGIHFRAMREEDWQGVVDLHGGAGGYTGWPKLVRDVVDQVGAGFVQLVCDSQRIIGYSTFFARTIHSPLPEYGPVFIEETYRGMGISSVLIARSLKQIADLGKADETQLSCYPNKFPVYPRQGFQFTHKYLFQVTAIS